jgi:F1F0 ATPase subunit 2
MADYWHWALVFAAGLLLGGVFFGGLWWTVQQGLASKRPALLFLVSLLLRTGVVLGGFYVLGGDDWLRLVVCLLGFVCARFIVSRLTRPLLLSSDK